MKISTLSKSQNFATGQSSSPPRVFSTNAFRMKMPYNGVSDNNDVLVVDEENTDFRWLIEDEIYQYSEDIGSWIIIKGPHDAIEMDLSNPKAPSYRIKMTEEGHNTTFARAAPGMAITMYGRYETIGQIAPIDGERIPVLHGIRGQGHMECPMFDLEWVAEKTGYPCKAIDMPRTVIHCDAHLPETMYVNTLIDIYFNWMKDGTDMNTHISANESRFLNLQIQCDRGREINPDAHAGGMSGAKVILKAIIHGIVWEIGYKHETANDNSFPFLSFAPLDPENGNRVTEVEIKAIKDWLFDNWVLIEDSCRYHDCDLFGVTLERLKESYIDSPHVLNEVLGQAVGIIDYERLEILVDGFDVETERPIVNPVVETVPDVEKKKKSNLVVRFLSRISALLRRLTKGS